MEGWRMPETLGGQSAGTSAIVTGGGRGLGRAMSEALLAAGASVLVVDVDQEPIDAVLAEVTGEAAGFCGDITDDVEIDKMIARAIDTFGHVDVVVNNAGIGMSTIREGDRYANPIHFFEVDSAAVRRFMEVHVMGPFLLSKAAVPLFKSQGFGRIVTVTTSLSTMLAGGQAPYGPAKAASEAFTAAMAADLDGTFVTANVLIPGGAADTRYVPDVPSRSRDSLVKPAVMGPPIVFLASREADGVNGRRIIAKNWDPNLPVKVALAQASVPIGWVSD
jgi:NAD(P)-dependent dehydrogenase (short-subunit alcohol dehydrogenase family)